jgi:hypothetical protein
MIGRELAGGSGIDDMSIMEVLGRHPTNSDGAERLRARGVDARFMSSAAHPTHLRRAGACSKIGSTGAPALGRVPSVRPATLFTTVARRKSLGNSAYFGGVAASWSMAGADLQRMAAAYLTDPTNEFTLTDVKFPGPPGLAD